MDVPSVVRSSSVAEVAWVDADGTPGAAPAVVLLRRGHPVLALTFDRTDLAHRIAGSPRVVLTMRETRGTASAFTPGALAGTPVLDADVTGQVYREELIHQELRRYPPSRLMADSPLLCRQHWWYLPRLLLTLSQEVVLTPPAPRTGVQDQLLVTVAAGAPAVTTVRVGPETEDPRVAPRAGGLRLTWTGGEPPAPGPAVLFDQDASFPDLERWGHGTRHGALLVTGDDLVVHVEREVGTARVPAVPGVLTRWRRQRAFEAACRAGIAAAE